MRKRNNATEATEASATDAATDTTTNENGAEATPKRGRRAGTKSARSGARRAKTAAGETGQLIEALLQSRGKRGATQSDLERVAEWAQSIRTESATIEAEAADLRKLGPRGQRTTTGGRQKQQKQEKLQVLDQRRRQNALDQALLTGVLDGRIALDVQPGGELLFLPAGAATGGESMPSESALSVA